MYKLILAVILLTGLQTEADYLEDLVKISEDGIQLLCQFEGFREHPYLDQKGIPTIGYGSTFYDLHTPVTMKDPPITQSQAMDLLEVSVDFRCAAITDMLTVPVTQNQFDALCSLTYNIGVEAFKTSTLLKDLNNSNYSAAADQFLVWNHEEGVVDHGLTIRRIAERALFLRGDEYVTTSN